MLVKPKSNLAFIVLYSQKTKQPRETRSFYERFGLFLSSLFILLRVLSSATADGHKKSFLNIIGLLFKVTRKQISSPKWIDKNR